MEATDRIKLLMNNANQILNLYLQKIPKWLENPIIMTK